MPDLDLINLQLETLLKNQEKTDEKISDIHRGLYDPEKGIYSKIKDLQNWKEDHQEEDDDVKKKIIQNNRNLETTLKKFSDIIQPLSDDLSKRSKRKRVANKLLWIAIPVFVGGLGTSLFKVLDNEIQMKSIKKEVEQVKSENNFRHRHDREDSQEREDKQERKDFNDEQKSAQDNQGK